MNLFDDLLFLASFTHGGLPAVRIAIKSLPREWILEHIENGAEGYLKNDDYEQYRRFLELFSEIDESITRTLAIRASKSQEFDIREAGEDYL